MRSLLSRNVSLISGAARTGDWSFLVISGHFPFVGAVVRTCGAEAAALNIQDAARRTLPRRSAQRTCTGRITVRQRSMLIDMRIHDDT